MDSIEQKMEGLVRKAAQDCLATLKGKTESDFIQDFTFPFPVGVVLDLMGLPRERMAGASHHRNPLPEVSQPAGSVPCIRRS